MAKKSKKANVIADQASTKPNKKDNEQIVDSTQIPTPAPNLAQPAVNKSNNYDRHNTSITCTNRDANTTAKSNNNSLTMTNGNSNALGVSGTKDTTIDADGYEIPNGNPADWNCEQVYRFVQQIAGPNVAQIFKSEEVDGSALTLIKDDHLVNTMQIKLGPALKILHKFNEIRAKFVVK